MQSSPTRSAKAYRVPRSMSDSSRRWVAGISIAVLIISLFVVAVSCSTSSVRANDKLCLERVANDEHTAMEAFFQNPADQDALVQAITLCAR